MQPDDAADPSAPEQGPRGPHDPNAPAPAARRPWEAARPDPATAPAPPWPAPAPDSGPELVVRVEVADEVAASRLAVEADARPGGLGTAILGGLLMLAGVVTALASASGRWKSPYPTGWSLLAVVGLLALWSALGWLAGRHLLPWLRRRAVLSQAARSLRPRPGEGGAPDGAPDGGGPARLVLGERSLRWRNARAERRFNNTLLRGLAEDAEHMVLRYGLASVVVLPRRDLSAVQQQAVRDWAARHARAGLH